MAFDDYFYFLKDGKVCKRKEGDEKTRRKIARRMKGTGIFSNEFIAELVELDVKTVKKLKGEVWQIRVDQNK